MYFLNLHNQQTSPFLPLPEQFPGRKLESDVVGQWPTFTVARVPANRKRIQRSHRCARSWQLLEEVTVPKGLRGAGIGSCHRVVGGNSGHIIAIADGVFGATRGTPGRAMETSGSGNPDSLSKFDKVHVQNASLATSSDPKS